ncbi:MAG: DNA translocase FtsK [Lachnospiraceae bacterium]
MVSKANNKRKSSKTQKKKATEIGVREEIIILLSMALCVLLLISNFGIGGFVGKMISSVSFGIFGWMAYVVPLLIFIGIAFTISNFGNLKAYIKTGAGVLITLMSCTFLQLVTDTYEKGTTLAQYYKMASTRESAGGFLGGCFVKLLCPAIGVIGTFVVIIVLIIICLVLITEKSFLKGVKSGGTKAYQTAREDARKRRIQTEEHREKRRKLREEQEGTASGVSFNTTLEPKKSPEIRELKMPEEENLPVEPEVVINRAVPLEEELYPKEELPVKTRKVTSAKKTEMVVEPVVPDSTTHNSYHFPPLSLLTKGKKSGGDSNAHLNETAQKLQQTLQNFGVNVTITNVSCGPSVTRYELQPEQGVKVSKIVGLTDDIKLNLAAADIRIEAPIPGKAAVGIEVPNKENFAVMLRDLLESEEFKTSKSNISFAVGRDISGKVVIADIKKMPHLLIAGATGSGKSVCINTLIMSILYKSGPQDVKLIMIDPKVVELSVYNGIPHLLIPVVTDPKKAAGALNWAVAEMTKRYQLFADYNVRDLNVYNEKIKSLEDIEEEGKPEKMPQIVIIVDELADLMMVAPGEVEEAICRLAQLARAAGIHLVLATQRPSVNVITGLIKANMPSRIAFSVSSGVDSRTIIDMNGAEKLLGKGDMLFYPSGYQKPVRVQGSFVADKEVQAVVKHLVDHNENASYSKEVEEHVNTTTGTGSVGSSGTEEERDVYFVDAGKFIIDKDKASIGMLQRVFKIGFNRAARIMDQLSEAGVVGEEEGTKPRKVLMSLEEFEQYMEEYV